MLYGRGAGETRAIALLGYNICGAKGSPKPETVGRSFYFLEILLL